MSMALKTIYRNASPARQACGQSRACRTTSQPTARSPKQQVGGPLKPDAPSLQDMIRLAQQGNEAAFDRIYQMHSRRVYALCLRMVGDPLEAEDLTQEAFL